jgi:hypothetical protein
MLLTGVNRFGADFRSGKSTTSGGALVSGMEHTSPLPSVSMGLVFRLRAQQAENRSRQMGMRALPGAYTLRLGEHERTLWNFRRDDLAGTLEIPRQHGLSRQAERIQSLRGTLYSIGQIIDDAKQHHSFGARQAEEIQKQITEALGQAEPWLETDVPEWATRPLPKSWNVSET